MSIEQTISNLAQLSSLLPAVDEVAVFDQNFNQVFGGARPIKASVNEIAKAMEHPVESGATITDFRIIEPVEINLSMILDGSTYKDTYHTVKQFFLKSTLLVVQTKTGSYSNMMINKIPHEEDPALFDTITMAISLKEVIIVTAQYGTLPPTAVKHAKDTTTTDTGQQQATAATPKTTIAQDIWKAL